MMIFVFFRQMQIASSVALAVILILGLDTTTAFISVPFILLQNIFMLVASRKNFLMLLIAFILAYCNYSVLYANFINPIDSGYVAEITQRTTNISLNVLFVFNCVLILAVNWSQMRSTSDIVLSFSQYAHVLYAYFLLLVLLIVFFYGFTIPTEIGERGSPKPIYEYALVFFIILFCYYKDNIIVKKIGLLVVALYALQNFIFGGRILGIQFLLCAYLIFYMNSIPKKIVLVIMCVFFVFMTFLGTVRGELLNSNFDILDILNKVFEGGFALDTAYSAYYCAESFVYCHDIIPFSTRLFLFLQFVKGVFISSDSQYVLQNITYDYVHHTGGGFIPHFLYFYLGPLGAMAGGLLVSAFLNLIRTINNASSGLVKSIAIYITCITFRWYLYSPLDMLRGVLFLVIVYYTFTRIVIVSIQKWGKTNEISE